MMRPLTIFSDDVLDLIFHAHDAGIDDPVLMVTFAQWLERLSDSEITEYCEMLPDETDTDADKAECHKRLEDFRDAYLTPHDLKMIRARYSPGEPRGKPPLPVSSPK